MKYAGAALAVTLVIAACGGSDSGTSDDAIGEGQQEAMVATMVRHGLDDATASCVAAGLDARLTPSMFADVIAADSAADIPAAWQPAVDDATDVCVNGEQPAAVADAATPQADEASSEERAPVDDNEPDEPVTPERADPGDADG